MAQQKLTPTTMHGCECLARKNPFAGTGTHVYGERFVGRTEYVSRLQNDCTSVNIAIRGLPKMGKTSLAYHSIIEQRQHVSTDKPLVTIFFSVGTCRTADEMFRWLTDRVYEELSDLGLTDTQLLPLHRSYKRLTDNDYDRDRIQSFFEQALPRIEAQVVVIFDEFDKVRTIQFTGSDFSLLRTILSVRNLRGVVVSKRSIYTLENWAVDPMRGPSTFYQLFDSSTICLRAYSEGDLAAYWKRLEPYFASIGLPLTGEYKERAHYYAGHHPHLLDVYNHCCYTEWRDRRQLPSDADIRLLMTNAYKANLEILREEGLLAAAVQVVIGPVYDISEEQFDRLTQYGFLLPVDRAEKMACIGCNTGYVGLADAGDRTQVWLAPSHYLSLLMKRDFLNRQDFWKEWCSAFDALRLLAERFLKSNWGDDWMNSDETDDVTNNIIVDLWDYHDKDDRANISTSPLIEYMTEVLLKDLIMHHWTTFRAVFAPLTLAQFCEKLDFLLKIRNHHAHNNVRFLSEAERDKANQCLHDLQQPLDRWFRDNGEAPLVLVKAATPAAPDATTGLRGRIDGERKKIYNLPREVVEKTGYRSLLIDRMRGFAPDSAPEVYDYAPDEEVLFELKETSRDGSPFYFAINVRPVDIS